MLTILLTLAATSAPVPAPRADPAGTAVTARAGNHGDVDGHGDVAWFAGSFDDALARARSQQRLVMLDFWADWCGWCKRLDRDVFSDAAVVAELADLVCYVIDKDSETGAGIARRYGVDGLPTLVFLSPGGEVLDVIVGYEPAPEFLADVRRIERGEGTLPALRARVAERPDDVFARFALIEKLQDTGSTAAANEQLLDLRRRILRGEGYDVESIDDLWRIVRAFRALGDVDSAEAHLRRIEVLDPERRSLPLREVDLARTVERVERTYAETGTLDPAPLEAFLADERHPSVRFEGWLTARRHHRHLAEEARKRGTPEEEAAHQAAVRRAERAAWRDVPPELVASFGHDLAWGWYLADGLDAEERAFAADVARRASDAAPQSTKHLDTLACCLDAAGRREEALATIDRALSLAPDDAKLLERRAELAR